MLTSANRLAAAKLALLAVCMFGFGYAMIPIYDKICRITGIQNLLNPAEDTDEILFDGERAVRVEFDTNSRALVAMTPNIRLINEVHPGKTYSVIYTLENLSGKKLTGQAVPSYGPARADRWFKKIQCFCFEQLTLEKDEVRQSPVAFVVDSELPTDINTIALSYTFFEVEGQ